MGLLDRWDTRNQHVVEKQNENFAESQRERALTTRLVATPTGATYKVVARPSGYPLRNRGASGSFIDVVIEAVAGLVAVMRNRWQYKRGWTVAVIAAGSSLRSEKVLRKERLPSKDEAIARTAEIAREIDQDDLKPEASSRREGA